MKKKHPLYLQLLRRCTHRVIIFHKAKIMASRSYDFNNLDLFSCQDLDYYGSLSPEHVKPLRITAIPPAEGISL